MVLLLRDPDATHMVQAHFKYGVESIQRVRAAARYKQMSPNEAATGALQPQVKVAAKAPPPLLQLPAGARQQPTTHAVPVAPPAQQRPEPQQQSASQWLQPEPPPIGTVPARTAPAQKQPREPQQQPARTAPIVQQQPPMLEQPQPATPVAPQQLQAQGPQMCVSPHAGPAGGTATPATSASGGDQLTMAQDWSSEHWNWGWHSEYSYWSSPPKCDKCWARRRWRSADTNGTFKWTCHHCWGQSKSQVHWVAVCLCGFVECEHCVAGWKGDAKCEAVWAAIQPSNTFMRATALATSDSSASHSGAVVMAEGRPPAPGGGLPEPAAIDNARPQCQLMTAVSMGPPLPDASDAVRPPPQGLPQHSNQQQPPQQLAATMPAAAASATGTPIQ